MSNLNGLKFSNGLKFVFVLTAVSGAVISGKTRADINFDGQVVPATDISSIAILPASGDLNIITIPGYTVTKNSVTPPPPGAVAITGFSASPATINEGQSTILSWTTTNAQSCTPSGGVGGWNAQSIGVPNGSTSITIATAASYTFTLTCTGAANDTAVRNVTVTVNTPAPPPVPGSCSASPLTGSTKTWLQFWGVDFPMPIYENRLDSIPSRGYKAYEFNTGNIVDNGQFVSVGVTSTSGIRKGAISECPGDFKVAPACDYSWGIGGGINWATNGKAGACQLQPNTTYYFSLTFTDGFDPASATCTGNCTVKIQVVNP